MLTKILEIREKLLLLYKKHEKVIHYSFKFIITFFIVAKLNHTIGYSEVFKKTSVVLLFSIFITIIPSSWMLFLLGVIIISNIAFASLEAAILIGSILLIMYLIYIRLAPKMSFFIIAVPVLFVIKLPYIVPLYAGIFSNPLSIIPIIFGLIIYYSASALPSVTNISSNNSTELSKIILQMYKELLSTVLDNKEMIFTVVIFTIIILLTYWLSKLSIDYIWYISIGIASLFNIIAFIIGIIKFSLSHNVLGVIISTIISAVVIVIFLIFRCVLDYTRAEKVQYEDDDYYYYVKAIPKIHISTLNKEVKHIK